MCWTVRSAWHLLQVVFVNQKEVGLKRVSDSATRDCDFLSSVEAVRLDPFFFFCIFLYNCFKFVGAAD